MTSVTVNFEELIDSASEGDTGYIRFKFDTQDGWGNEWMRGWVVDDIEIQGTQSAAGTTFAISEVWSPSAEKYTYGPSQEKLLTSAQQQARH